MRIPVEGWQRQPTTEDALHWLPGATALGDDAPWTFRTQVIAPTDGTLRFDGIATLATVLVDDVVVAESESMWVPVEVPVRQGERAVEVRCRALTPELAVPRKPRARWRQKVAADNNLRWFRTTLCGRAPGFAPGPPVVGLWRPVWFVAGEPSVSVRARLDGDDGVVTVRTDAPDGTPVRVGNLQTVVADGGAELRLPSPARWWPHTHGEPVLYEVEVAGVVRRVGFRTIESPGDILRDGLRPRVNGVDVFVRGALWTPTDDVRATLETARDHGLNAIRIPGTMVYETRAFHDLCDELGLLVWQDLMFANLDYPFEVPEFRAQVDAELDALIDIVGGRPSLFCVCGGSEIEQQVAMLGLDPALGRPPFLAEGAPARLLDCGVDALYVPSAPCGADRPLLPGQGVSNWFGVGGYLRPFADIRSAGVRFASECLAIANVGDDVPHPHDPAWKDGVPGDVGTDWDFDDVRDHYLAALYDVDPERLRATDPDKWLKLSRAVSGDVMTEVFGEWRRAASGCGGGFVLWLRDLVPGAGWGLIDSAGAPKPVLRALRHVLAPVAVWMTDEVMGGYAIHVANDASVPLDATVVVRRGGPDDSPVDTAEAHVEVPPHAQWTGDVETVFGRWVDAAYTYRFGPPAHQLVVAELRDPGGAILGTAQRFPVGRAAVAA
ncbi:MAG: beta-mannosidase [Solirubrobacteraceae bacterium]|nr:beta-mannosidase [Solirubrobacteraceae bacterium]